MIHGILWSAIFYGFLLGLLAKPAQTNESKVVEEWLLETKNGLDQAISVAADYGFTVIKELEGLPGVFLLSRDSRPAKRSVRTRRSVLELSADLRVFRMEKMKTLIREKRDLVSVPKRLPRVLENEVPDSFNDPFWSKQWYLLGASERVRTSRNLDSKPDFNRPLVSLNVVKAWKSGFTGKGVVVTILDDGLEKNHTDLVDNYDPHASTNINGGNRDPMPRYDAPSETHHGTRCAGEVAMKANNNVCGVGTAFDASIGGIRMLDGVVTDRVEAEAFSFNNDYIHIYSSSWGPSDNGRTVERPGVFASRAMEKGATEGRNGRGVLYVWASGNGGLNDDNCAYDGYASNVHTIGIGSATEQGQVPVYGEQCASTMAVTYSSGFSDEGKIVSTDLMNSCTTSHTGTSASAPLAAGILALVLQANPELTLRDIRHLIVWTSDPFTLLANPYWYTNGVGLLVHPYFGFGLMDAELLTQHAQTWETAPELKVCTVKKLVGKRGSFSYGNNAQFEIKTKACRESVGEVNFLEQVELIVSVSHPRRGLVRISLESPSGTKTVVGPPRIADTSPDGLKEWPFVSLHNWGENPVGTWLVNFESLWNKTDAVGTVTSLTLVFYGTSEEPKSTAELRTSRRERTLKAIAERTDA